MKVTALAPWYGSKRTLGPLIVGQLGPHASYWEPFCGSLAVLFAKPRATMETVNDLHGDLVNLARTVQCPEGHAWLEGMASRTLFADALFADAKAAVEGGPFAPTPERAYQFLVYSWFGRNGTVGSLGGNNFCVRYTSNGGQPATRWGSVVRSLADWHDRLRGVVILGRCGLEMCERVEDKDGAALYADPPYLVKGERYVHDFAADDHVRLAAALRRLRKTRCVVSYYDHPALAGLYPGWTKVPCDVTKAMVSMGRRDTGGVVKAPEVLLVNGPPVAAPATGDLFGGET